MSEEKKVYAGASFVNAAKETEPTGPIADSGLTSPQNPSPGTDNATPGKGQSVLPGILGKQLRAAYGELLNSPVPDRFNDLIKQLQHKEAAAASPTDQRDVEEGK